MSPYDLSFLKALAVVAFAMAGFMWLAFSLQEHVCEARARQMGLPYAWSTLTGCMVETSSGWVPLEAVRVLP